METVYTLYTKKTIQSSTGTSQVSQIQHQPVESTQKSGYQFQSKKTNEVLTNTSKPPTEFNFFEENFPPLSASASASASASVSALASASVSTSSTKNKESKDSCWSNVENIEIIKKPYVVQEVLPKKKIPPLFSVKRTQKKKYYEEDDEKDVSNIESTICTENGPCEDDYGEYDDDCGEYDEYDDYDDEHDNYYNYYTDDDNDDDDPSSKYKNDNDEYSAWSS